MFLPEMEKANRELESAIQSQGAASVVMDTNIVEGDEVLEGDDVDEDEVIYRLM